VCLSLHVCVSVCVCVSLSHCVCVSLSVCGYLSVSYLEPTEFSYNRKYKMTLQASVIFCCNDVEKKHAEARAEKQLVRYVYNDLYDQCHAALNAISSGNKEAGIKLVVDMLSMMEYKR